MVSKSEQAKLKYEGVVFNTKYGNHFVVTKYINKSKIYIKFLDTGYETTTSQSCVASGSIRDRLIPSVFNVGILGDEIGRVNGVLDPEYVLWRSMLQRCYSKKKQNRSKTYQGCSVSENFKYYSYFKDWCRKQIGFNKKDNKGKTFHLDKDILTKGNKTYSEDTCCFVPAEINTLVITSNSNRGNTPVGVHYSQSKGNFQASCHVEGRLAHLGYYNCPKQAFLAYKEAKEKHIKDVVDLWKGDIDERVHQALMSWEIRIDD